MYDKKEKRWELKIQWFKDQLIDANQKIQQAFRLGLEAYSYMAPHQMHVVYLRD